MAGLLRERDDREAKVGTVELFFDLVFVFAVTQLSHRLLAHLTLLGAVETALLFAGIWWVWVYTAWCTNWLDPERKPVRSLLFLLMAASLFLSMAIPEAFEARGLVFAAAYAVIQVGRSLFMVAALRGHSPGNCRNFQRITVWLVVSGAVWIAGGLLDGNARLAAWAVALAIETAGPALGFLVPGTGRSTTGDWDVEGGHIAERCGLFIIIALGESVLITGATFAETEWSGLTLAGFTASFVGSIAMWWIYFNIGAERAAHEIAGSSDPGRLARLAYTYLHLPIVAGIIVSAAADELVLTHAGDHLTPPIAAAILGGPALFLLGNLAFKAATSEHPPLSHIVGLGLLGLLVFAIPLMTPLVAGIATSIILLIVAEWETLSLGRKPGERH